MVRTSIAALTMATLLVACSGTAPALPDSGTLLNAATAALGAEDLIKVEFTANGWDACLGQAWNVNEPWWARWELRDYNRVIDYEAVASRHTAQQRSGLDPTALGGCGAQPGQAARNQQSTITANSSWAQQLQIWLTPYGFIRLARDSDVSVESHVTDGQTFNVVSFTLDRDNQNYRMRGYFNDQNLMEKIETWLDNAVFGDMLVEAEFTDYRDFEGLLFPARILHKQGGLGILELNVNDVVPNSTASAAPPQAAAGGGGGPGGGGGGPAAAEPTPPFTQIGPGVFVINGNYQAVAVEFEDFSVVIDGMQNEARSRAVIEETKNAIPGKPIRYVVVTHSHFDHVSGLRDFVAEGTTIVTHEMNVPFFDAALNTPRTLNPDRPSPEGGTPVFEGIGDNFVLDDGTQVLELYRLRGHVHADDMVIAYLPSIGTIVESDLVQPWINPAFAGGAGDGPHPYLVHLANELERLGLDYQAFVPVHRPNPPPTVTRAALMAAVGRTN